MQLASVHKSNKAICYIVIDIIGKLLIVHIEHLLYSVNLVYQSN